MIDKKVANRLQELAQGIADTCCKAYAEEFEAEEVAPEQVREEGLDPKGAAYSSHVYGSNQGPAADLIIAEDLGLTEEEAEEVCDWDLSGELEGKVNDLLTEGGCVFWEDNCLFWRVITEQES